MAVKGRARATSRHDYQLTDYAGHTSAARTRSRPTPRPCASNGEHYAQVRLKSSAASSSAVEGEGTARASSGALVKIDDRTLLPTSC